MQVSHGYLTGDLWETGQVPAPVGMGDPWKLTRKGAGLDFKSAGTCLRPMVFIIEFLVNILVLGNNETYFHVSVLLFCTVEHLTMTHKL